MYNLAAMKAVILAGGAGTRISEETTVRPKPMVDIGPRPILWHIMKHYAVHGITDFVVCVGYKSEVIKSYFANYHVTMSDVTFDLGKNTMEIHRTGVEDWRVTLVDTGQAALTGCRIKRIRQYVEGETFCLTYGDGVSNVDITALVEFHKAQGTVATLTAVQPPGRFGAFTLPRDSSRIESFREKPEGDGAWINGGFFVLNSEVFDYIPDGEDISFEQKPMVSLAHAGQMSAYRHEGFWQPMDTLRDKNYLEDLWKSGKAPWKTWDSGS